MIGDLYTSPWGRYAVHRTDPLTLRALSRENAFVVLPGDAFTCTGESVGSGRLPVTLDPPNEKGTGRSPCSTDGGDSPLESTAPIYPMTLGAFRSTSHGSPTWIPCKIRSEVAPFQMQPHAHFLGEIEGSIICPTCRALEPRMLYTRDGEVIRDTHHDVASAVTFAAETPAPESSGAVLSPAGVKPSAAGSGPESSEPELLAGAAARALDRSSDVAKVSTTREPTVDALPLVAEPPNPIGRPWIDLDEWKEWCAERAAIIEYDANQPREVAEFYARELAGPAPRAA